MKIATVVGARPQFVKAAPLSRAIRQHHQELLIHTGQHYDPSLSDVFFQELGLPAPDIELGAGSGSHGSQTARMLAGIEEVLIRETPDLVLVYGDTNSTLAGSLAAAKLHIPVAHVEAGLRSFNRRMPEETNRVLTDHMSSILFCPTDDAAANLRREGISKHVHMVGDIMCDAVLAFRPIAGKQSTILSRLGLSPKRYNVATVHRNENTDSESNLRHILTALARLDRPVVLPLHPRARFFLRKWTMESLLEASNLIVTEPLSYLDMLHLTGNAHAVLTDSGGLQKEAYLLRVPCVTMRRETEWVETVAHGWNRLAAADTNRIWEAYSSLNTPEHHPSVFGDGRTAPRICHAIEQYMEG
ncbi:non-hydrolyzing UDP-N-acetylglucosamine 2-epimerase [Paenibacillus sp. PL2-23]|uniref:non-hydrolyzing UDP-N-acetylglucosamine 2-epimerase n=1 Tax=Paenibacillus sp. PL2-23 TaxID=2100729 RepID=UPI0030FB9A6A